MNEIISSLKLQDLPMNAQFLVMKQRKQKMLADQVDKMRGQMNNKIIERQGAQVKISPAAAGAIVDCYQKYDDKIKLTLAILDTMALFGFEIISMPESDKWLSRLRIYERLGHIDLSAYDLENEADREFLFLRYIFIAPADVKTIGLGSGMDDEDITKVVNLL